MRGAIVALVLVCTTLVGCLDASAPPATSPTPEPPMALAILDTPSSTFQKVLCDNGGCLRRLTTLSTGPANEVMVQIDYSNPLRLIAGSKDYHSQDPTCTLVSVYVTSDGGRTWKDGYARPRVDANGAPSSEFCETDPVIAFDGRGNAILETLGAEGTPQLRNPIHLHSYRTTDHGVTWKEVTKAFVGPNDKNWLATDYRTGRIYSVTGLTCQGVAITYTDDVGETWQGPFCLKGFSGVQIDVAPDGTLYLLGNHQGGIAFTTSPDAGSTWTTPVRIAATTGIGTSTPRAYRTPTLPDLGLAYGTGWVYATWHDGRDDVFFSMSQDKGATWSAPIVVNDDASTAPQFVPAVAASPNGDAHVVFFDARNDPAKRGDTLDVYYAHLPPSALGAGSDLKFEKNIRLTPESFLPYFSRHQNTPVFIGDYIGIAATNGEAVSVFPTTRNQRAEIHAAIVGG